MWLEGEITGIYKKRICSTFLYFSIFVTVTARKTWWLKHDQESLLTLSRRLQPAGDKDLCSSARSSVYPVMNQAGVQWHIETKRQGHQKKRYVSNKNHLNVIQFFPFQGQVLRTCGYHTIKRTIPVMGYWMGVGIVTQGAYHL